MGLDLSVAVMANANAALASHLSLRPEQKAPNIEARLIFCVTVMFGTAIVSGISLILLCINFDLFFSICVGALFFSGVWNSIYHVWESFDLPSLDVCKTPLSASSLFFSTMAFILAVVRPNATTWITIPNYYFILTYHLLVDIESMPRRTPWAFALCASWTGCSIAMFICSLRTQDLWYAIAFGVVSGIEAIILASIGFVSRWKRRTWERCIWERLSWERRRRLQMNLTEA